MGEPTHTVFVIDDDPSVRRGLERVLRASGHGVEALPSAEAWLEREPFDGVGCLVLDVHLGGMDGMDLHAHLEDGDHSDLPVIFLTGNGDIPMGVRAMKRGAVDFLTKPVDDTALLAAVDEAIERHRRRRRGAKTKADLEKRLATLTPREMGVLRCLITGAINKQIGTHLGIAEKTVKVHRARVFSKMGTRSVADLVRISTALRIEPDPVE